MTTVDVALLICVRICIIVCIYIFFTYLFLQRENDDQTQYLLSDTPGV